MHAAPLSKGHPDTYLIQPPADAYLISRFAKPRVIALVAQDGPDLTLGLIAYALPKFEQRPSEIYIYDLALALYEKRGGARRGLTLRYPAAKKEVLYVVYSVGLTPSRRLPSPNTYPAPVV